MIPLQLATLYREHRSIAAVLKTFEYLVRSIKQDGERVSPQVSCHPVAITLMCFPSVTITRKKRAFSSP